MLDRLTIAAANANAQPGETTRNLEAIFHHASRAAAAGAQVLPGPAIRAVRADSEPAAQSFSRDVI